MDCLVNNLELKQTKYFFVVLLLLLTASVARSQDWANLSRFKDGNAMLMKQDNIENRVVFMGNSITEMWEEVHPDFFSDKAYINRGISGQTTPQMLVRFRQDVIALQPEIVVILAGTNDIAGNTGPSTLEMIEDNIASMAELAKANKIKVILCSVLPAYDYKWAPGLQPAMKIPVLNAWIKKYASVNNHIYLDYYYAMVNKVGGLKPELSEDGLHPNKLGYQVMVPLAKQAIEKTWTKK